MSTSAADKGVKTVAIAVVATTTVVSSFMMSSVSIAIPTIGKEFAMEAVLMGWVVTAMTLPQVALLLSAGRLADIFGLKRVFLCGMALFTVSAGLCAIAGSGPELIVYRVLQGISAGFVFGTSMALLTAVFPGSERGRALGINMASAFVGIAAGPLFGGVLTQHLGWRSIFYITTVLGAGLVALTLWKLKGEWAAARGEKYDFGGFLVFAVSIVLLMYGLTLLPQRDGFILAVIGIAGLLVFGFWETRTASPILDLRAFRGNRVFIFSNVATMINYMAMFATTFLLSIYLQHIKGLSPQMAGLVLVVSSVIIIIFSPIAGRLSDKIAPNKLASMGLTFNCIGMAMLYFLGGGTPVWVVPVIQVPLGLGVAFFGSPNSNAIMGSVAKRYLGVAAGTQGTTRSSGMMLSMAIVMILFSIYIGGSTIMPENYPAFLQSMKLSFAIFCILCFAGIFIQYYGGRMPASRPPING